MARRKWMQHHRQALHNQRLCANEILCEECGAIYDLRTGQGLCVPCSGEAPEPDEGGGSPAS